MNNKNRIAVTLAQLKANGRKALVSYIVVGDPNPEVSLPAMHALVKSGADILELGIPFSDPMAEGPVIQKGHERALEHNTSLRDTLKIVEQFRESNSETPIVLMGYVNPIERMGYAEFANAAGAAGVDGVITVDLPPEEVESFDQELKQHGIENIFLLAPTTSEERIKRITAIAGGFLYYVSLKGVTGAGHLDVDSVDKKVTEIRRYSDLPVLVGFGIKNSDTAKAVGALADGVVIGSVLVSEMGSKPSASSEEICERLNDIVSPIRSGLDSLTK